MVESAAEKMVLIWECNLLYQQVKYVCFLWNWVEMSSYQAFIQKKKKIVAKESQIKIQPPRTYPQGHTSYNQVPSSPVPPPASSIHKL